VMGREKVNGSTSIFRVTPSNGAVNFVTSFESEFILGAFSAFDPNTNTFWILATSNNTLVLYAFDITSGKRVLVLPESYEMVSLEYDEGTSLLYALGEQANGEGCTLLTMDPNTGDVTVKANLDGWVVPDLTVTAIDTVNRNFYCYIAHNVTDVLHLLTLDMDTGDVLNAIAGPSYPWGIAYMNKQPTFVNK